MRLSSYRNFSRWFNKKLKRYKFASTLAERVEFLPRNGYLGNRLVSKDRDEQYIRSNNDLRQL
jgi:hypothetical protein